MPDARSRRRPVAPYTAGVPTVLPSVDTLLGVTSDIPDGAGAGFTIAAATQYFMRLPILKSGALGNLTVSVSTLGVTLTHCYLAWYNSAGTMVLQSADQSAVWTATGVYTTSLGGTTPVVAGQWGWAELYAGTAATPPAFRAAAGVGVPVALLNLGAPTNARRTGIIALADTAVMPSVTPTSMGTGSSGAIWVAAS